MLKYSVVFAMFLAVCLQRVDPDFGWHIQAGRYISSFGTPKHDLYSYTASNFRWIDHEWGYDVILSWLFRFSFAKWLIASIFASIWTFIMFLAAGRSRFFTLAIATFAIMPYAGVRPTIFTILLFTILIKLASIKAWKIRYVIPFLFIIWGNLHGGLVAGLVIMVYFLYRDRDIRWLIVLALSFAGTLINPYGINLYTEIIRTIFDSAVHSQIQEWASFKIFTPSLVFLLLWPLAYIYNERKDITKLLRSPFKKQNLGDEFYLGPIMLVLAMSATRNMPLFITSTVKNLDNYLNNLKFEIPKKYRLFNWLLVTIILTCFASWVLISFRLTFVTYVKDSGLVYPVEQVVELRASECKGNVFNDYNYGGYIIWQLPGQKVYIDGRMPVWRDENGQRYMDRYFRVLTTETYQKSEFVKYDIQCALVGTGNSRLINSLKHDGWRAQSESSTAILLFR